MNQKSTNRLLKFLFVCIIAFTPLFGSIQNVHADEGKVLEDGKEIRYTAADLLAVVEHLEEEGEISDDAETRILKTHLTAIGGIVGL